MSDNNILEEQRKARENYLELKRMQQGEISPEPKPSEVAVMPKTFSEKMQNFWFHYKWHTIGIAFVVIVLTILVSQCANREKYDMQAIYFTYNSCLDSQLEPIEEYLEKLGTDVDGNGEVNINLVNCSFSPKGDAQYKNSMLTKIQTQIIGNREAVMYIMDQQAFEYLNGVVEGGVFGEDKLMLDEEFYKLTETKEFGKLPEGLGIYLRRTKGTNLEKDEKVIKAYNESKKIIDKMK